MKKFMFCIVATCIASAMLAQTPVPPGNVSGTWNLAGSPYLVQGDVYIQSGQSLVIEPGVRVEFQGHYACFVQGSLIAMGAENDPIMFTINDSTGWHNINVPDGGWRGIRFGYSGASSDSSRLRHCTIAFGKATGGAEIDKYGGAVAVLDYPDLVITRCVFTMNAALENGGAIAVNGVSITFQRNTFWSNKAITGGAITMMNSSSQIFGNYFVDNHASNSGGALSLFMNCHPEITNNLFAGNFADYGGAVQVETNCDPTFRNNLIYSNVAYVEGGGVDLEDNCQALFVNNTIVDNFALFGGGVDVEVNTSPTFHNCILWGNTAFVDGPQIHLFSEDSDPDFYWCDIKGGIDSIGTMYNSTTYLNYTGTYENNIDLDPDFYILGDYRYLLNDGSPCIDAGNPDVQYNDLEDPDNPGFALFPSKGGLRNDMGTYGGPYTPLYVIVKEINELDHSGSDALSVSLFPNPASGTTCLRYLIHDICYLKSDLFMISGIKIGELERRLVTPGEYEMEFDVSNLPAGVYIVRVQVGNDIAVKKLIVN